MPSAEDVEDAWAATVRASRRAALLQVLAGALLVGLAVAWGDGDGAAAYFRQEGPPCPGCPYAEPRFPWLDAGLALAGALLVVAGVPFVFFGPPIPDRAGIEAPLGLGQAVWERLPLRQRMRTHLRARSRNLATLRLAVATLLLGSLFAALLVAFARHGGLSALRADLGCHEDSCPSLFGSPPAQDALAAAVALVALLALLLRTIRQAVRPVREQWIDR